MAELLMGSDILPSLFAGGQRGFVCFYLVGGWQERETVRCLWWQQGGSVRWRATLIYKSRRSLWGVQGGWFCVSIW